MRNVDLNDTLRQFWLVGCLSALVLALERITGLAESGGLTPIAIANLAIFCIFVLRFFVGNLSYISATFGNAPRGDSKLKIRAVFDLILLFLHILSFVSLAAYLGDCRRFQCALIALLLTDLWWMVYEPRTRPLVFRRCWAVCWLPRDQRMMESVPTWEPYPPSLWIANNVVAACALLVCWALAGPHSYLAISLGTSLVSATNTLIDLRTTGLSC